MRCWATTLTTPAALRDRVVPGGDGFDRPLLYRWQQAIRDSELGSSTKLVALVMSTYMSAQGTKAFPGQARLARDTGLSDRSVRRRLRELVEDGWLEVVRRGVGLGRGGAGRASEYRARIAQPDTSGRKNAPQPAPDVRLQALGNGVQPDTSDRATGHQWPAQPDTSGHPPTHDQPMTISSREASKRRLVSRALSHFGPRGWSEDDVVKVIDALRMDGADEAVIDEAIGFCIEHDRGEKPGYLVTVVRNWSVQRSGARSA